MPWLRILPGSGSSVIAPTSTGTPTAATASLISLLREASRNGSSAVEFSGQTTKSGAGTLPASASSASWIVASTWLRVTWRWS